MCGITGFLVNSNFDFQGVITSMTRLLNHRGPDVKDVWVDANKGIALGHARLSILDLSKSGNQPMVSKSGRYVIVLNGEIYNYLSIRNEIDKTERINWNGTSDTEIILQGIELWGLEKTIEKCVGMFAIALWDKNENQLSLVRDRMGEKPLYYGWIDNSFVFASELISLKCFPNFENSIDRSSLALYLKYSSIPEPFSIYKNIHKVEKGSIVTIKSKDFNAKSVQYWSTANLAKNQYNALANVEETAAINQLESLLLETTKLQMQADVPLGAFLSGGIDSSIIVALMQAQSSTKVNTFTIGFEDKKYNEAGYAKEIAKHLGTNHHELIISGKDVLDIVPMMSKIYSEPFSEASQIPTFLVSKLAKQFVSVSLSGDAGDELFCGYSRYKLAEKTWNRISPIPLLFRKNLTKAINTLPIDFWKIALSPLNLMPNKKNINYPDKFLKGISLLNFDNRKDFYHEGFIAHNLDAFKWVIDSGTYADFSNTYNLHFDSFVHEMQISDMLTYLPNNNLVKVDRAAMANSLETRVPMLDHRVVEYALGLPMKYKYRNGISKWIVKQVLYKYVPKEMFERPKMGFAVPLETWLRGPLKDWGNAVLDPTRLNNDGFFNVDAVRKKWSEHISGKRNWHYQLWDIIVFNEWLDEQKK